jgi:diacylglycerol kinase (ATP)
MVRRRALLLLNPNSRRGEDDVSQAMATLEAGGITLAGPLRLEPGRLVRALRAEAPRLDLLIVGGGDGTLNAVAEALLDCGLPFGILPLGTGNDLARTLGIPLDPVAACAVIITGETRRIDLGWVNGKHFFNAAAIGLSVAAAQRLTGEVKRRYGPLGYPKTLVDAWRATHPFLATIRCDGEVIRRQSVQIVIGNGRHHGAGMTVAAAAAIDDHRLDVYSLDPQTWWRALRHLPALRLGADDQPEGIWRRRCVELSVTTDRPLRVSTDGEVTTRTPALFRVVPEALEVLAPRDAAARAARNPADGVVAAASRC